jgi:heme/copper-type cytochrome/quinol oxidase subunit 3
MTSLHGLHIVGGAIVLAYFLFFNGGMFKTDPEHLANRVEVGGLFWHFVDIVWMIVFPVLYLF